MARCDAYDTGSKATGCQTIDNNGDTSDNTGGPVDNGCDTSTTTRGIPDNGYNTPDPNCGIPDNGCDTPDSTCNSPDNVCDTPAETHGTSDNSWNTSGNIDNERGDDRDAPSNIHDTADTGDCTPEAAAGTRLFPRWLRRGEMPTIAKLSGSAATKKPSPNLALRRLETAKGQEPEGVAPLTI